jgi:outer membrane lipoprotein-sorting protein
MAGVPQKNACVVQLWMRIASSAFVLAMLFSLNRVSSAPTQPVLTAAITPTTFITEINLRDKMSDGRALLQSMQSTANQLEDYSCDCTLLSFKKKRPTESAGRFYYKKPGLVRVEAVTRDFRNGSVVVRRDGRIRGMGGGMLKSLKMNLDEDSRVLRLPNGYCVVKTDFPSLFEDVKQSVRSGCLCRATKAPTEVPTAEGRQSVYVFEVYRRTESGEQLVHRVLINPERMLPIEWAVFKDGKIITTNLFKNLSTNKGLSKDLFTIG